MATSRRDEKERFWLRSLSDRLADLDTYFRELGDPAATPKFKQEMAHLVARTRRAVRAKRFKDALLLYHEIEDQFNEVRRDLKLPDLLARVRQREKRADNAEKTADKKRTYDYRLRANELIERKGRENLAVLNPHNPGYAELVNEVVSMMPKLERKKGSALRNADRWIKPIKDRLIEGMNPAESSAPHRTFGSKRP